MKLAHNLDRQIEMHAIIGESAKAETYIKGSRPIRKRFDGNRINSQLIGRTLCAPQGVYQQQLAHSLSLRPPINGKPPQENNRHWMMRKILGNRFKSNRATGNGVVPADGDRGLRDRNIGPAEPAAVVLTGIPLQVEIEGGLSTIEL